MTPEIYIRVNDSYTVTMIHRNPFDPSEGLNTPREELEKDGFFVSDIPVADIIRGRRAVPKYNPDTKKIYYDYVPVPLSTAERVEALEDMMNEMIMGGN